MQACRQEATQFPFCSPDKSLHLVVDHEAGAWKAGALEACAIPLNLVGAAPSCSRTLAAASRNEIEGIRQLERAPVGLVPWIQVAVLVTDIGKDGIALRHDLIAFPALERYERAMLLIGAGRDPRPALECGAVEIPQGCLALPLAAAGDEEHRDVFGADGVEKVQRRADRRCDRLVDPVVETARHFGLEGAGATLNEAVVVGLDVIP